ncbi:hypothetical protein IJG28_02705 [Candidatus Saccharibacteria bacterium]|nr:hypothetical protein [Candidatus Saccharibacteria bacterium]
MRNRIGIFCSLIVSGVFGLILVGGLRQNAYADVIYGDGTGTSDGTFRACNAAKRWQNVRECSDKHGGASWHVFKTSNLPLHDENAPNYDDRPILTASLWDGLASNETKRTNEYNSIRSGIQSCPSGYYVSFVYDGWYGEGSNWSRKSVFYYGPLAWKEYDQEDDGVHHTPIYHKGGTSYTAAQINAGFKNGTNMNGWRISGEGPTDAYKKASDANWRSDEATKLFRLYAGDNSASIPKGTGWFCYNPPMTTLTGKAVNTSGSSLSSVMSDVSTTVDADSPAAVTRRTATGYTYYGWASTLERAKTGQYSTRTDTSNDTYVSGSSSPKETYNVKSLSEDKTVYAVYEKNTYQGMSRVAGATGSWTDIADSLKAQTGWKGSGTSENTVTYAIKNCDPVNGCSASIRHLLKQRYGRGSTEYKITRTSNYSTVASGTVVAQTTEDWSADNVYTDSNGRKYRTVKIDNFVDKMYPGMVVCETLEFKPDNLSGTNVGDASTTACVIAEGNAQPPDPGDSDTKDPSADTSFVNIKVKNNSVAKYNAYQRTVYAKPGDSLTYRATYNPVLQYTYHLIPERMRIDSGTTYPTSGENTTRYLGKTTLAFTSMFDYYKNSDSNAGRGLKNWNNGITVYSENFATTYTSNHTYNNGETAKRTEDNSHSVAVNEVGRSLNEVAKTNVNDTVKTTPSQVTFAMSGGYNRGSVSTADKTKTAYARVPYNYVNTTEITTSDDSLVFAGETFTVAYNYIINPKTNSLTTDDTNVKYATTVGKPQWKLRMRVNGGAWTETSVKTGSSSSFSVSLDKMYTGRVGNDAIRLSTTINVPDVSAGSEICLQSMVYPASSGSDDNLNSEGDGRWASSAEKCFTIAKRPSIQVWGGNIYTQRDILTSVAVKNNLAGMVGFPYGIEEANNKSRAFGSWGELGIVASGTVSGLASGASTGYAANNNGLLTPNQIANPTIDLSDPGGSTRTAFCDRSRLTFANTCVSSKVGGVGNVAASNGSQNDKELVINRLAAGEASSAHGNVMLSNDTPEYTYSDDSLTVGCGTDCVLSDGTKMIRAKNNLRINSNIKYADDSYTKLSLMPKVVFYANRVEIDCNVSRIDALIIADTSVDTCPDSDGEKINEEKNSHQLIVNGAVIASKLLAHRTYGAATGANSIVSAEIINFDPSLYMWGGDSDEEGGNEESGANNLEMTYLHELAPRK